MTTPDPTTALLPPARLAEIRERVAAGKFEHTMSDRAALLARLDALTPPAVPDGEALGRLLLAQLTAELSPTWTKVMSDIEDEHWTRAALALHAIGYAAGRSEGEAAGAAERIRYAGEQVLFAIEQVQRDAGADRFEIARQRAEIARLTAELAEARAVVTDREQKRGYLVGAIKSLWRSRDAARLAGAREERRLCLKDLYGPPVDGDDDAQLRSIAKRIEARPLADEPGKLVKARGEGQGS